MLLLWSRPHPFGALHTKREPTRIQTVFQRLACCFWLCCAVLQQTNELFLLNTLLQSCLQKIRQHASQPVGTARPCDQATGNVQQSQTAQLTSCPCESSRSGRRSLKQCVKSVELRAVATCGGQVIVLQKRYLELLGVKALTWSCIVGPSASPYSRRESRVAPRDHRQLDRSIVRRCASDCLKDKAGMAHKTDSWMLRRTRRGMLLLRKAPTTLQVRAARIMRRAISEMLVLETMWGVF